jgi:hypothetical protein
VPKAFTKDGASYLSWYSVELMNPVSGLEVTLERKPSKMDSQCQQGLQHECGQGRTDHDGDRNSAEV